MDSNRHFSLNLIRDFVNTFILVGQIAIPILLLLSFIFIIVHNIIAPAEEDISLDRVETIFRIYSITDENNSEWMKNDNNTLNQH